MMITNRKEYRGHVIVSLPSEFNLYNSGEIKKELFDIANEYSSIIISFEGVHTIDSSGLGILAIMSKTMKNEGKKLSLCAVSDDILQVMQVTSADRYFEIYKSFDQIEG